MTDHADTIRKGIGSLRWLLDNAHNHDAPEWPGMWRAATDDAMAADLALDALVAERDQARAERDELNGRIKVEMLYAANRARDNRDLLAQLQEAQQALEGIRAKLGYALADARNMTPSTATVLDRALGQVNAALASVSLPQHTTDKRAEREAGDDR